MSDRDESAATLATRSAPPSGRGNFAAAFRALLKPETVLTLALVLLFGYALDNLKAQIPWLVTLELKSHYWFSLLAPGTPRADRVALVDVDDTTFWYIPADDVRGQAWPRGTQPTNRRFLANLVIATANADAAVITLDFAIKSEDPSRIADDESREADDLFLLSTIKRVAATKRIPIVVSCGFVSEGGQWTREPNIFDDTEFDDPSVHGLIRVGYINLPRDKRQVPLQMAARDRAWDLHVGPPASSRLFDSLALASADAYDAVDHMVLGTEQRAPIKQALERGDFLYARFLKPGDFPKVSALDLLLGRAQAADQLRHRLVIIGGTWHQYSKGNGPPIESFASPIGDVPGLYLHANYAEALLGDHVNGHLPWWFGTLFDLIIGVLIYLSFRSVSKTVSRVCILALFFLPLLAGYVLSVNFGVYLDFLLPLGVVFVHLIVEHYRELRTLAKKGEEALSHAL